MSDYEYQNLNRKVYDGGEHGGELHFVPVCDQCFKFVKADAEILTDYQGQPKGPNATCKKDGRVQMLFEGYF